MRYSVLPTLVILAAAGCSEPTATPPTPLNALEQNAAVADARRFLGDNAKLIAICGPSEGVGLYLDELEDGFQPDSMSEGIIGFAIRSDGAPEIVFRDALKEMVVASEHGGVVSRLPNQVDDELGIWTVSHAGGLIETYNLTTNGDGSLFALWTGNRNAGQLPGRVITFISACTRV